MVETKAGGVQCQAGSAALVWDWLAVHGPIVNALAADGSAAFPKVNAELVRTACLEPALDQRVIPQLFQDVHMSDRPLTLSGLGAASAAAVASVSDQARFDTPRFRPTADDGPVTAFGTMRAKLPAKVAFGSNGARENDEPRSFLIEPVNCSNLQTIAR